MKHAFKATSLLVLIGILPLACVSFAQPASRRPNVLLIITDDQGYGDLGLHGNEQISTPTLDRLGRESIRFDRFFVSPLCAPTRASLLTGRYSLRAGVSGVAEGQETMRAEELTIAKALGAAGYRTCLFGKWHNGEHYPYTPNGQGFQEAFGFNLGHWNNYFDTTLKHNGRSIKTKGFITDVLTDAALKFIEAKHGRPFFCYLSYNAPHSPFQVPDKYFDKYKAKGLDDTLASVYGMVENVDDNVARVLGRLDELKLRDNTIVIFMTDNGPNGARFNGGMRGVKGSLHEGGSRVPFFLRWPARFKEARSIKRIAAHIDLFPTLLELCGAPMPKTLPQDGRSLVPLLEGKEGNWPDRTLFTQHRLNPNTGAVRTEHYRMVNEGRGWELFDMESDPGQKKNIAAELRAGVLTLPQGRAKLTLHALTKPGDVVMDLKSVVLKQMATAPSASRSQKAQRPNILFAIADDWSYGHAGAYGGKFVRTPAFDRVAHEGVLFTRAFTPNAKCAPSRAIILTGRNSWQLEEAANHIPFFPAKFKTWVEALGANGYFTGLTAKGWAPGVANDANGKPRQMAGRPFNQRKLKSPADGIENNDYAANFEDFLNAAPQDQPWSFWYGALEPHRAYESGSGVAKGGKRLSDVDRVPGFWPDNDTVRNDMLDYAFEVEHFDRHLGQMLASLEQRGLLENTIVIVTSDHGMPFPRAKGQAYDASNHVPLAVMWKNGIKATGRTVSDYVSFADFAPTLVELAGLKWRETGMQPAIGRSLTDILFSNKAGRIKPARNHALVGKERHDVGRPNDAGYPIRGIHKNDLLYIRNYEIDRWPAGNPETGYLNCDGGATKTAILQARREGAEKRHWQLAFGKRPAEELYDISKDPDCLANLADDPKYRAIKQKLRRQMERELKAQGDPRMFGRGSVFDQYQYANPEQRNFYERFMRGEKLKAGWVNESDFEKEPIR